MKSAKIESNPFKEDMNISTNISKGVSEQKIKEVEFIGQYMQIPQKNLTFADLVQIKMQNNYERNLPMVLTKKAKKKLRELGDVFVERPNLSRGARLKRNKHLRELGLWSLWNNLHQSKGYLVANGPPVNEKLTKGARRRLRKMREQGLTHAQIHKMAIARHLKNNWSEVAVQTRYEAISTCMVEQTPSFNDVEQNRQRKIGSSLHLPPAESSTCRSWYPMETGILEHPPSSDTTPTIQSQTQSSHCGYNASGSKNAAEDTVRYLQVTIVPEGYPNVKLNQEQAEMIKNALLAKIDLLPPETVGPKFSDINLIEGAIVVACLDNYTQRWLEQVITVCSPRRGIKLMISKQVTAVTLIPGPCEDPEVILRRMRVQNEKLFTESWRILGRSVTDMGQELVVSMDESEWIKIEEIGFMPFVNFSRVLFTAL